MSELTRLLEEVAGEAKAYGDPERAVRTLRRRRRAMTLAPFAAAVVVLLAVTITYTSLQPRGGDPVAGPVSWLPSRLDPVPDAAVLHGPVAAGALVYYPSVPGLPTGVLPTGTVREASPVLLTVDGTHYRLPGRPLSLSPDGRQLVSVVDGSVVLRDLITGSERALFEYPEQILGLAWSSDRLAIQFPPSKKAMVVDLPSGRTHLIPFPGQLCGAQDSGPLLSCGPLETEPTLSTVDSDSGASSGPVPLDLRPAMTPDEQRGADIAQRLGTAIVPLAGARTVAVRTTPYQPEAGVVGPGDILLVSVSSGEVQGRIPLTQQIGRTTPQSGGIAFLPAEGWNLAAGLPDGIALIHVVPEGRYTVVRGVEFADPATGHRTTAMTVTGSVAQLLIRGAVSF